MQEKGLSRRSASLSWRGSIGRDGRMKPREVAVTVRLGRSEAGVISKDMAGNGRCAGAMWYCHGTHPCIPDNESCERHPRRGHFYGCTVSQASLKHSLKIDNDIVRSCIVILNTA